jgi:thioredoxin-related protein
MVFGLLLAGASDLRAVEEKDGGILWLSYEQGLAQAKQQKKKVFLYFYTDWCRYCEMMTATTFVDKKVVDLLNQDFVSIRVNSEKARDVAAKYQVRGVPVSFFLEASSHQIGSRPGYMPPDEFLKLLGFVAAEGYTQ